MGRPGSAPDICADWHGTLRHGLAWVGLVARLTLEPMALYGAHVEEILAVLAECVLGRHVNHLEMLGERLLARAHHRTEVTPTQLSN